MNPKRFSDASTRHDPQLPHLGFAILRRQSNVEMLRYLNEFYALCGTTVRRRGGVIERFLPDGIVAYFGPPGEAEAHEERAVRAALDIVRLIAAMETRWAAQRRRAFRVGVGLHTGRVIIGESGYIDRREVVIAGPMHSSPGAFKRRPRRRRICDRFSCNLSAGKRALHRHSDKQSSAQRLTQTARRLCDPGPGRFIERRRQSHAAAAECVYRDRDSPGAASGRRCAACDPGETSNPIAGPARILKATFVKVGDRAWRPGKPDEPSHIGSRFKAVDDDEPAMPEAPWPASVYEDDEGPPLGLPP